MCKLKELEEQVNQLQEDFDLLLDVVASQSIVPIAPLMPAIERARKRVEEEK